MLGNLKNLFGSSKSSVINEKLLQDNNIPIIKKGELFIDKSTEVALTLSGKFYLGKYKGSQCTVKILEKQSDEHILSELIFWKSMFSKERILLDLLGVYISGHTTNLVFEYFSYTLDKALVMNILKDDSKVRVVSQILYILDKLQNSKKIFMGLRPAVFGVKQGLNIKLIDYGNIINFHPEDELNKAFNEKFCIKYYPPEKINFLEADIASDIWSFGCILLDLFSDKKPVYKMNISSKELFSLHEYGEFPPIADDITGFLKDIIVSCLDNSLIKRIKIENLVKDMNLYIKNITHMLALDPKLVKLPSLEKDNMNSNTRESINEEQKIKNSKHEDIKEIYEFVKRKNQSINSVSSVISEDLMTTATLSKETAEDVFQRSFSTLNEKLNFLNTEVNNFCNNNLKVMSLIKEKIIMRIVQIQETIADANSDIFELESIIKEMKYNVMFLADLPNYSSYINLIKNIEKNRDYIEKQILKYTKEKEFDQLYNLTNEIKILLVEFKYYAFNEAQMLDYLIEAVNKSKKEISANNDLSNLARKLKLEKEISEIINFDKFKQLPLLEKYFAVIQDDSDLIYVYDLNHKKFYQNKIGIDNSNLIDFDNNLFNLASSKTSLSSLDNKKKETIFNQKLFSIFRMKDKSVYFSGGKRNKENLSTFAKIEIVITKESKIFNNSNSGHEQNENRNNTDNTNTHVSLYFTFKNLADMIFKRSHHSMIWSHEEENLLAIGGLYTKTCEVYSIKNNKWHELPELNSYSPNSSLCIHEDKLYCFNAGTYYNSYEGIYILSLKNFNKIYIEKARGFDFGFWEELNYSYQFLHGRLKKSMAAVSLITRDGGSSIILFGGFDTDVSYYDLLELQIRKPNNGNTSDISRLSNLSNFTGLNSNNNAKEDFQKQNIRENSTDEYGFSYIEKNELNNNSNNNINNNSNINNKRNLRGNNNISNKSSQKYQETITDGNNTTNSTNTNNGNNNTNFNNIPLKEENSTNIYEEKDLSEISEEDLSIKIKKLPYELPVGTYFNSNYILEDEVCYFVCGNFNAIEFNIKSNEFYYYT